MRISRILIVLALFWLAFTLFQEARAAQAQEDVDGSKIVMLFGGLVLVGGTAGVLMVIWVVPLIGDAMGNVFFSPNQDAGKSPHAGALGAVARGDYDTAIEEYRKAFEADPSDTYAVSEIARIYCNHLEQPDSAVDVIQQVLAARDWSPDQSSFLRIRLADVQWKHQHDARGARESLLSIIGDLPGTPQAANATHKLQELERELAAEG